MTIQDEADRFHEALLDFAYEVVKALGIIRLCERLNMEPREWIWKRQTRDLHRSITPEQRARLDELSVNMASSSHGGISLAEAQYRVARAANIAWPSTGDPVASEKDA